MFSYARTTLLFAALLAAPLSSAEDANTWTVLGEEHSSSIEAFAKDYRSYLDASPSEMHSVQESQRQALRAGFREVPRGGTPRASRPFFVNNRGRALVVVRPGNRPIEDGLRVIAAHIDAPRLELKARPAYQKEGFVLWQTVPHGGIKYYQWVNVPLALIGEVHRTDGTVETVEIGLADDDPIFLIPDLSPHVDRPRRSRTSREVVKGEELDPLVGSLPGRDEDESPLERILSTVEERLGFSESDFVSAELHLVPATRTREVGLDRSMIVGYGQDDRACSYAALRAILDGAKPEYWSVVYLADNEESGSNNNTGARSQFFSTLVGTWLEAEGRYSDLLVRKTLANSIVASADITTAINPMDPSVQESGNASKMNHGVVIKRYGRGSDAHPAVLARIRGMLEREGIPWQTHTYKVDVGGGGTLGGFLSVWDMEVFDVGIPLLSLHSPAEVSSKADLYALYLFFDAFLQDSREFRN